MSQASLPAPTGPEPESNLTGRRLGDFLLLRRLGRGGMAEVYLAEQGALKRQVAFKILRSDLARDPHYVSRFHFEAQAAARLVQANIVQIYDVGEIEGFHYIAQEYVKGQNLKQYLHRHGAVDVLLAVNLMRQVAAALGRASEQGVTHRDIKPENILIATTGEVKVADFGLARVGGAPDRNHQTQIGIAMGTPLYMSPEQVEGKTVDPRSDLYSFGVTCYEMLAGRPPFEGDTALSVAVQHLKQEATPLREIRPDVPPALCELIHRLMAKRPEDRPASAVALLRELRQLEFDESDERWAETLEQLVVNEAPTLAGHLAITQRLDALMKQEARIQRARHRWMPRIVVGFVGSIVAAVLGAAVASSRPPRDLLEANGEGPSDVPVQASVEEQLRYALRSPSERNFLAVERYWPRSASRIHAYYSMLADVHLGELHLRAGDDLAALDRYRRLENVEEQERRFLIVSHAGQGIVQWRRGNLTEARRRMVLLDELTLEMVGGEEPAQPTLLSRELLSMLAPVRSELGFPPYRSEP